MQTLTHRSCARWLRLAACVALLVIALSSFAVPGAAVSAIVPEGDWFIDGTGAAVQIFDRSGLLCGRVIWLEKARDLGDRDPVLDRGQHADLPIGDMTGEDEHPPPGCDCPVYMLKAVRLDPAARLEHSDLAQVRIFGGHPSQIVPHVSNDSLDLNFRHSGECPPKIAPSALGDGERGADSARQRAAEG